MPAPPGNCHNPHGRPCDLSRELQRLEEAARHVDNLFGEAGLYLIAADEQDRKGATGPWRQPWKERADAVLGEAMAARGALADDVRRLMGLARELTQVVPAEALRKRRQRGDRPLGASAHEQAVAQASIWLDRVIPDDLETN